MGSFLFAKMFGLENNIYLQTGLIMLIGLLAKTAILITDYAEERRRSGMSLKQAAVGAARNRLRPILMTALIMIFGMLPLMFASGVGRTETQPLAQARWVECWWERWCSCSWCHHYGYSSRAFRSVSNR